MTLFVKFVPWNENTYRSLKNNTIKLSTVYELNDYHEFGYWAPFRDDIDVYSKYRERIKAIIEKKFGTYTKRCELIDNLKMSNYTNKFCSEFSNNFKSDENFQTYLKRFDRDFSDDDIQWLRFIIENIAYSSVGIFSCAEFSIFKTEWSQLLYAYYADSLKGLALIYEQNTDEPEKRLKEVDYKCQLDCGQGDIAALEWAEGNFKEMATFNQKLRIWKHEREFRICNEPGMRNAADFGISLKAVLYTQRIADDLFKIREAIQDSRDSVDLEEIYAGYGSKSHLFKIAENDKDVFEWIQDKYI